MTFARGRFSFSGFAAMGFFAVFAAIFPALVVLTGAFLTAVFLAVFLAIFLAVVLAVFFTTVLRAAFFAAGLLTGAEKGFFGIVEALALKRKRRAQGAAINQIIAVIAGLDPAIHFLDEAFRRMTLRASRDLFSVPTS